MEDAAEKRREEAVKTELDAEEALEVVRSGNALVEGQGHYASVEDGVLSEGDEDAASSAEQEEGEDVVESGGFLKNWRRSRESGEEEEKVERAEDHDDTSDGMKADALSSAGGTHADDPTRELSSEDRDDPSAKAQSFLEDEDDHEEEDTTSTASSSSDPVLDDVEDPSSSSSPAKVDEEHTLLDVSSWHTKRPPGSCYYKEKWCIKEHDFKDQQNVAIVKKLDLKEPKTQGEVLETCTKYCRAAGAAGYTAIWPLMDQNRSCRCKTVNSLQAEPTHSEQNSCISAGVENCPDENRMTIAPCHITWGKCIQRSSNFKLTDGREVHKEYEQISGSFLHRGDLVSDCGY